MHADGRDHFGGGGPRVDLDVGRDLDGAAQLEGERPPARLRYEAVRDLLGGGERRVDLDVEGDERGTCGDERRAGGRVQLARAEVGRSEPSGLAELRPGPTAAELAVEVHGHPELADLVGEHERLGAGRAALRV